MNAAEHTWALVLAAGEGSRLRSLTTTTGGVAVPKQFCSLQGGRSLLHDALARAQGVAPRRRICTVVAEQHRRWWERSLGALPCGNVIVQPENRGTAIGILLPLLHIAQRDPDACVVVLPSDHYVRDEHILARALRDAVIATQRRPHEIVLLGLEAQSADPELGYIASGEREPDGLRRVVRFVEKPFQDEAEALVARGALWNVFIMAARVQTLLVLYAQRYAPVLSALRAAAAQDAHDPSTPDAVRRIYRTLPTLDFSRDVLEGAESSLRVLATPACGWSDLGTPERVAQTLRHAPAADEIDEEEDFVSGGCLNLARQHSQLQSAVA